MAVSRIIFVPGILAVLVATTTVAQEPTPSMQCQGGWRGWFNGGERVCEVREMTVPATGSLAVDGGPNGGVNVKSWDRNEVLVHAVIQTWGDDEEEAREVAGEIVIHTDGTIRAEGPDHRDHDRGWSVSYEVFAPRNTNLRLETTNGGIAIEDMRGDLNFETTNGGINLDDVAGNVLGRTTNGGVDVTFRGDTWEGAALDLKTTNGGVRLHVPSDYSARLEVGTVNGGIHIDFPVTVQGRLGREISTTLGEGGSLVSVKTTNGGVRVDRY